MLDHLLASGFAEVVVADGGSTDATRRLAEQAGVTLVDAPRGRGPQMNAGALGCRSPLLLFLHADTLPPPDAPALIRAALRRPEVAGGCFRAGFDEGGAILRFAAWCTRFETGLTTFGDQGFFMRRRTFDTAGGFPDQSFLEDVAMRRRLLALGRFQKLRQPVRTSARRFEAEGRVRRFALNGWILLLHRLGVGAERLAGLYRAEHRSHFRARSGGAKSSSVRPPSPFGAEPQARKARL